MVPYVDPKSFSRRRNNNNQVFSLNEKSDVYSVGVLLWEISSGQPPFHAEGEQYDVSLILEISQGLRETIVPDTPKDYIEIYTKCWDGEPDNRPTIYQVVEAIITKTDIVIENPQLLNEQEFSEVPLSTNNSEPRGELSQLIQNFCKMNTNEIDNIAVSNEQEKLLTEEDFNRIVDEINYLIFKLLNKGTSKGELVKEQVIEYLKNYDTNLQEIYNWLLINNQNISNSIFLLGYFNYKGIETRINYKKAFNLFINASENNHILAQYFVGVCYFFGHGIMKNEKLALKYFKTTANKNLTNGQKDTGYCYENGIGIEKDLNKAFYWYEKAANNGNIIAIKNLGICYRDEIGVKKDHYKAFELFKQSAEGGYSGGMISLGYCYELGIGTKIDKQKAFELYLKSANLGNKVAQYNIGVMYENGDVITKDLDKAIYWYKKSAKQGHQFAKNKLEILQKNL
ncbi:hypothetical protein C1646_786116 [Rhizophagus diaphanus]|nr:hypothetical protein C1646_786116 [Rhizophagus diaphanus] [Rhizophagus sp. MUCL 43196]